MKRVLYLNCFSGISGDMLLGALLDLLGEENLEPFIKGLNLQGFYVTVERSSRKGIAGLDVRVVTEGGHPHRGLAEITGIINGSTLSSFVREKALETFTLLAEAEGAVHGKDPQEVHFHEVGGVDSIVDIVGTCALLEAVNPCRIVSSAVNVGSGTVFCAHGELPVPAPATMKLLEGVPVFVKGNPFERATPTGIALLRAFGAEYGEMPSGIIECAGYGLGDHESDLPNLLQAILLREDENPAMPGLVSCSENSQNRFSER